MNPSFEDQPSAAESARYRRAWWTVAAAAAVACGVWTWVHVIHPDTDAAAPAGSAFPWNRSGGTEASSNGQAPGTAAQNLDRTLEVDTAGHLKVTRNVRNLFDSYIDSAGKDPLPTVRARIAEHIDGRLPKGAATEAKALLDRYLDYRSAMQDLAAPESLQGLTPDERQARLYLLQDLRSRHFSPEEGKAFFGDDLTMEGYSVSRLQALQDPTITPIDKAHRLKQLRAGLPASLQASQTAADVQSDVAAVTRDWRAAKGTPAELRAIREELAGVQGADQIEAQDRETTAWKQQLHDFSSQRKAVMADASLSDVQRKQALEQLRQQALAELERRNAQTQ